MRSRPLIGVTGPDKGGWPAWTATRLAVWRAGGRAVRITPMKPLALDSLNALIIGGGADVNPRLYNEDCVTLEARKSQRREMKKRWRRRETLALFGFKAGLEFDPSLRGQLLAFYRLTRYRIGLFVDYLLLMALWIVRHLMSVPFHAARLEARNRDELEVPLVRDAIAKGLPVLGICRGMQLINVCLGGSLYQEISVFYEESPIMTTLLPRKKVAIEASSKLSGILRRSASHVNSLHYQSVKTLGAGLVAVARESNGVIQAIEHPGQPFLIGVQWHPEYLTLEKPSQQRLFRALIDAARLVQAVPNAAASNAPSVPATNRETIKNIAASQSLA